MKREGKSPVEAPYDMQATVPQGTVEQLWSTTSDFVYWRGSQILKSSTGRRESAQNMTAGRIARIIGRHGGNWPAALERQAPAGVTMQPTGRAERRFGYYGLDSPDSSKQLSD